MIGAAKLPFFGSALWSPAMLSQVWLWLTAGPTQCFSDAGGTTPCADGDAVYVWKDRSGNGHDLSQSSSGLRPLLRLISGQWRVRFDGTDDTFFRGSITTWPTTTGFASSRFGIVATGHTISTLDVGTGQFGAGQEYYRYSGDGNAYVSNFLQTRWDAAFAPSDTVSRRTYTQVSDSTTFSLYEGGSLLTSQAANWKAPVNFGLASAGGQDSNIDIAGIVAGASILSSGNRALLEAYLAGLLT